jgi:hypothetical protein
MVPVPEPRPYRDTVDHLIERWAADPEEIK